MIILLRSVTTNRTISSKSSKMTSIREKVASIIGNTVDHKQQIEQLKGEWNVQLVDAAGGDGAMATEFLDAVINNDGVPLVVSRQIVAEIITGLIASHPDQLSPAVILTIGNHLLALVQPRIISYEEQVANLREFLAKIYEAQSQWRLAANMLTAINLEGGQKSYTPTRKMRIYVQIAQLYLEEGDSVEAESYVNRASLLQNHCDDPTLFILYKAQYARVLDSRRKYVEAAQHFYDLSLRAAIAPSEQEHARRQAVQCAVLAPAGQPRVRMLTTLYKDERCHSLKSFPILQKMYLDRLIRPAELSEFSADLDEHHKALTTDGITTVLDRAMMEHNVVACSRLYANISFAQLAKLLGVDEKRTERLVCNMITEGRLNAHIDQLDRVLHYKLADAQVEWDAHIERICQSVNDIADRIQTAHPEWTAKLQETQAMSVE